jgi:hypothetical protein
MSRSEFLDKKELCDCDVQGRQTEKEDNKMKKFDGRAGAMVHHGKLKSVSSTLRQESPTARATGSARGTQSWSWKPSRPRHGMQRQA